MKWKQDTFYEPSLVDKKVSLNKNTITPTANQPIDIFNADGRTRNSIQEGFETNPL